MNYIESQLRPVLDKDNVLCSPLVARAVLEPTALATVFTASPSPDGTKVVVDQYGNIIG